VAQTTYETLLVERSDGVATVTFNRPERRNAMNPKLHMEMSAALDELEEDDDVRVLVVTGAGDSFCAGQDLKEYFADLDDRPAERARARRASRWRAFQLRLFPKPTIAAVNGWCFGGAFTIVASCDIAVAAEEAVFGLSEVNFGKLPGGHVTRAVTDHLHPKDALFYILTGRTFTGRQAAEMKFVTYAVPRERLRDEVAGLAAELAAKNPVVLREAKEAYRYGGAMDYEVAGAWLSAKSHELDLLSGKTWKKGVEQFKSHRFRPGLGDYDWKA
jgi:trans-feruloyl-CoA hydratase/vanillin synthase